VNLGKNLNFSLYTFMTCFVIHRSSILIKIGSAFEVSNIHINIPSGTDNPPNIHFASHWRDNINVNTEIRKRILENHQKNMGDDIDRSQCLPKRVIYIIAGSRRV